MYEDFKAWLDGILETDLPKETVAVCFNLYDEEDGTWSVQLIGAGLYDEDNDEWACEEVYSTEENLFVITSEADWSEVQLQVVEAISKYIEEGKYKDKLTSYKAVAAGFVDGDLVTIYPSADAEE